MKRGNFTCKCQSQVPKVGIKLIQKLLTVFVNEHYIMNSIS